ncbi:MAG: hypothetical protein HZB14_01780 [Actinobacteria bacterium]|nr:hypothetical protein [Actinomycetota bacterium]
MKAAVDAGVLLDAYAGEGSGQHDAAAAIERVLADDILVVTAAELSRFVEIVSDPANFEQPPELAEVAALCNDYAAAANVEVAEAAADDLVAAMALLRENALPGAALDAALLAACLRRLGVSRLISRDASEYAPFSFLDVVAPAAV